VEYLSGNPSSGGSGVLLDNPELMGKMYLLARIGLIVALAGTIALLSTIFLSSQLPL
jgi:hypothetical protein